MWVIFLHLTSAVMSWVLVLGFWFWSASVQMFRKLPSRSVNTVRLAVWILMNSAGVQMNDVN